MAAVLKHWRESATLILATSSKLARGTVPHLTSANSLNSREPKDNFDVLLLKRSSNSKFMPNMYVFPGGVAVNNDFSTEWFSVFCKLGTDVQQALFRKLSEGSTSAAPMFSRQREPPFSLLPSEVAFRICAIRETFEESGVLLAVPSSQSKNHVNSFLRAQVDAPNYSVLYENSTVLSAWRKRVNEDPNVFLSMCLELDLIPEIWTLYEWANWLTPVNGAENRRRFDTAFFVSCVDHKPHAVQDEAETVNALWASPSSLLSAFYNQSGGIAPPQFYELARLVNFQSASELLDFVGQPNRSRVNRFLTCLVRAKDCRYDVLPGDDLYPEHVDPYYELELVKSEESLEDLNNKYPNHNQFIYSRELKTFDVQCTLTSQKGHVYPDMHFLNSIRKRAKL